MINVYNSRNPGQKNGKQNQLETMINYMSYFPKIEKWVVLLTLLRRKEKRLKFDEEKVETIYKINELVHTNKIGLQNYSDDDDKKLHRPCQFHKRSLLKVIKRRLMNKVKLCLRL